MGTITIEVRCAARHCSLWFHFPGKNSIATDQLWKHETHLTSSSYSRSPARGTLTPLGEKLIAPLFETGKLLYMSVRTNYLDLTVPHGMKTSDEEYDRLWRVLLPEVAAIFRQATMSPVKFKVLPHEDSRIKSWHAPLLKELFG